MTRDLVTLFKALGDRSRIRIVRMLQERQLCVCEVREILGLSNSTVSKHLSILRAADIVVDEKDGKWVNFRLNRRSTSPVVHALLILLKSRLADDYQIRKDLEMVRKVDRNRICGL
jgi:ArsR family transcriptional regulator